MSVIDLSTAGYDACLEVAALGHMFVNLPLTGTEPVQLLTKLRATEGTSTADLRLQEAHDHGVE